VSARPPAAAWLACGRSGIQLAPRSVSGWRAFSSVALCDAMQLAVPPPAFGPWTAQTASRSSCGATTAWPFVAAQCGLVAAEHGTPAATVQRPSKRGDGSQKTEEAPSRWHMCLQLSTFRCVHFTMGTNSDTSLTTVGCLASLADRGWQDGELHCAPPVTSQA
jgi:hypothetical protein